MPLFLLVLLLSGNHYWEVKKKQIDPNYSLKYLELNEVRKHGLGVWFFGGEWGGI